MVQRRPVGSGTYIRPAQRVTGRGHGKSPRGQRALPGTPRLWIAVGGSAVLLGAWWPYVVTR